MRGYGGAARRLCRRDYLRRALVRAVRNIRHHSAAHYLTDKCLAEPCKSDSGIMRSAERIFAAPYRRNESDSAAGKVLGVSLHRIAADHGRILYRQIRGVAACAAEGQCARVGGTAVSVRRTALRGKITRAVREGCSQALPRGGIADPGLGEYRPYLRVALEAPPAGYAGLAERFGRGVPSLRRRVVRVSACRSK